MKKSLIIGLLLAAIAGVTGVVIGVAVARARHGGRNPSADSPNSAAATDQPDSGVPEPKVIRFAKNPSPTPPFLVTDLDGKSVSTAQLKGKVVLINFWATWCPPCRAEIPDLIALQNRYRDKLQIIGISMDDEATPAEVKSFAVKFGMNYPIVMDDKIGDEYGGIPGLPTSFVVNKDGAIVQKHVGMLNPAEIDTEVRSLLGMPIRAQIETFEDTGQIFLKNAERATDLPGVDLSDLTPQQKAATLKRLNSESCTCGCKLTIAQCRINDGSCAISVKLAAKIVDEVKSGAPPPKLKGTPDPARPSGN